MTCSPAGVSKLSIGAALTLAVVLSAPYEARAQETSAAASATTQPIGFSGNARAINLLHELEERFDIRETVYLDIACTKTVSDEKGDQQMTTSTSTFWRRQRDKLVWMSDGKRPWSIVSDGNDVMCCLTAQKQYTLRPYGRRTLDGTVFRFSGEYGVLMTHLACPSLRGSQPVTFTRGEDLGTEDMMGTPTRHLRMGSGTGIVDVWLNDNGLPVHVMETMQQDATNITKVLSLKWNDRQPIPERSFYLLPPEDAKQVDFLPEQEQ